MELLAPAGTFDCVIAAVNSGADAVYFAGQAFGARSFAGNLTDEEIFRAVDYCHLRGVRVYVTVNTLIYDREFSELERFIKLITRAGADGVIVQDLGIMEYVKKLSPDIEVHASTQMTVHSLGGVKTLEEEGVCRVVLSRELSENEIRYITENASAETEVFVHGAMCMCYSGQCLMSSVIGGRSGNRGRCAQPCRLPYSSGGKDEKFYLSLKDMLLAEHLESLRNMGVASLKIEGRMKGEQYVSTVVSVYRRLIDEKRQPDKGEIDTLNRIFFRGGLTDGYFTDKKGTAMFAFDKPDNPYLKTDSEPAEKSSRRRPIEIYAEISEGEKPFIRMTCGENSASEYGDIIVGQAEKRPLEVNDVKARLSKMGDTAFTAVKTEVKLNGRPFMAVSQLNELRRICAGKLENEIILRYKNKRIAEGPRLPETDHSERGAYSCSVLTMEQFRAACRFCFERIYVPVHIAAENVEELKKENKRIVLTLPVIIRGEERIRVKKCLSDLKKSGFEKVEISTIDGLELSDGFEVYASHRMNITNSYSFKKLSEMGAHCICLSTELNLGQMRDIKKSSECEVIVYGRIPLMITENCILKNMKKCPCDGIGYMTDRTGTEFPIIKDGNACRSVVLNSVPLYMADKKDDLLKIGADFLKLMFTVENAEFTEKICRSYLSGDAVNDLEFTRLRMFKGALA